jgi:hypothetical protein
LLSHALERDGESNVTSIGQVIRDFGKKALAKLMMAALVVGFGGCFYPSQSNHQSGGIADLIPGRKEAQLRKRVEADSFPDASRALHAPVAAKEAP